MKKLNLNFPVYSYKKKPKTFNDKVEGIVAIRSKLHQLQQDIKLIHHKMKCASNQINLFINNIFDLKKPFDCKVDFLILDIDKTSICKIRDLENLKLKIALDNGNVDENLLLEKIPKAIYNQHISTQQYETFIALSEKYTNIIDHLEEYNASMQAISGLYDTCIENLKTEFLTTAIKNYGSCSSKVETFNDNIHDIVFVKFDDENYDIFYVRKENKEKFLEYINNILEKHKAEAATEL